MRYVITEIPEDAARMFRDLVGGQSFLEPLAEES